MLRFCDTRKRHVLGRECGRAYRMQGLCGAAGAGGIHGPSISQAKLHASCRYSSNGPSLRSLVAQGIASPRDLPMFPLARMLTPLRWGGALLLSATLLSRTPAAAG